MRSPQNPFHYGRFLALSLMGLLFATPALGAILKDEQNCINELNKGLASVAKAQGKEICSCIKNGSKGKLEGQTIEACTTADSKGKVLKAKNKTRTKAASKCTSPPSFGPTDPNTVNAVAVAKELILVHQIFGSDLDTAILDQAVDPDGGKCQVDVAKATKKCQDTRLKEYNKCKKDGLKSGGILGTSGLEACVGADPKGKIAKACDDKLTSKIDKKCVGKLAVFPGCNDPSPPATSQDLASCLDQLVECEVCEALKVADDLSLFCEACTPPNAEARLITDPNDLIGGPLARGVVGDYLMENGRIRVIIQKPQRDISAGVGQFGGNIIDADLERGAAPGRDMFYEWAFQLNTENTANYQSVVVLNDGSDGNAAVIRATGPDDLWDIVNPSSQVADFGFPFPSELDDTDQPVTITTDYILEPGENALRIETTVINNDPNALDFFLGDLMGSFAQEPFHPGYGIGEPLVAAEGGCAAATPCDFVAWAGEGETGGVSYGYIHDIAGTSTFNTAGISVAILGESVLETLLGLNTANFPVAGGGGTVTVTRYLAVGQGAVSDIVDIRNRLNGIPNGTVKGRVTLNGVGVADAEVVALGDPDNGPNEFGGFLDLNVVSHFRTDAGGNYQGTLPSLDPDYELRVNLDGHLFGSPDPASISVVEGGTVTQDFTLSEPCSLRVTIEDESQSPIAAKVSVVGFDPSPDPGNTQSILGAVNNDTGVFGRPKDLFPYGLARVIFVDDSGDSGDVPLEPGDYQLVVSHGTEYSTHIEDISCVSGSPVLVEAMVAHVLDTTGFISGDFHVHSFDSFDCAITRNQRIVTMLAEGVDFFTPADHEIRVDFTGDIAALGVSDLLGTATNNEITSPDYGHFGGFPVPVDPNRASGGAVDWAREAPPGEDFPSFGNYGLSPGEIYAAVASAPGEQAVHIHHVASFFDGGLRFDTGLTPPESTGDPNVLRLDPSVGNFWDPGFTAMELWIQTSRGQDFGNFLGENMGNWFNLLNQGIVKTGFGDSDTHHAITVQSGFPRAMIASPSDDPGDLSALAETLAMNLNDGRVVSTNAPFMRVTGEGDPSEMGGLALGMDTVIRATGGSASVTVEIQSPTWAEFDRVEFYVNSETVKSDPNDRPGLPPLYGICPDFVQTDPNDFTVTTVPVNGSARLEATVTLSLSGLTEDTWVVAVVKGTDGVSCPLFPVVPNSLSESANPTLTELKACDLGDPPELGVNALAFSNPLFFDVDGNGDYDAPGVSFQSSCP